MRDVSETHETKCGPTFSEPLLPALRRVGEELIVEGRAAEAGHAVWTHLQGQRSPIRVHTVNYDHGGHSWLILALKQLYLG